MTLPVTETVKSAPLALFGSPNYVLVRIALPLPTHHRHPSTTSIHLHRNFAQDSRRRRPISYDDDDDESDEDRSLDLLVRFVENVFKKVSKRAGKAVRSILPIPISTHLVGFSVNGFLVLAFLWLLKAFLQVACTLGSVVFVSILLIRGIWSGVSFLQENRHQKKEEVDEEYNALNGAQPVT